ncbi:hypothetical protein ACSHT0_16845 [Tepidicaulis sp. LMO-SS28]|uniref:hypothetical protein n=1 Tax=Tepidicaulis sp. LMO-SS28 TaxID=3447455 RepID=UPI003EE25426
MDLPDPNLVFVLIPKVGSVGTLNQPKSFAFDGAALPGYQHNSPVIVFSGLRSSFIS